jgi:hypothetical protein
MMEAIGPLDGQRGFTTAYMYSMQNAMLHRITLLDRADAATKNGNTKLAANLTAQADHWLPGPDASPAVRQAALDRLRNSTRIQMIAKAFVGALSPLAPALQVGDFKLRAELQQYMTKYGYSQGLAKFQQRYPDDTPDTVFLSDSAQSASDIPATQTAFNWVEKNAAWVKKNPVLGAYLIPQTAGAFNYAAYNQEAAYGLRIRRSPGNGYAAPDTMIGALYAAATDPEYYQSLDNYEKAWNAANGDPYQQHQLTVSFDQYKTDLGNANPMWEASQNDPTKVQTAKIVFNELQQGLNDGSLPQSPQLQIAEDLVASWNNLQQAIAQVNSGSTQGSSVDDLKSSFYDYLSTYSNDHPASTALITGIFRRLLDAS